MKPTCLPFLLLLVSVLAPELFAQRRARIISPEVHEDGRVTFRLQAAKAAAVEIVGQWPDGRAVMEKGDNDVWEATLGPVPKGIWEYSLQVDGLSMIDPANAVIKPMRSPRTSILHLPCDPPSVYDFQDVPHGTVHHHTYHSKSLGWLRELAVYTPPGYGDDLAAKYPTLYLQHGSGDNQATWTVHGKAHWIVDNLISAGSAKPMVVVMMDGHASRPGARPGSNAETFEQDLLSDVMPFVEKNYRVFDDPQHRGIVGLSMGGGQSLSIGLNHTDKFAWVGGFSSAVPSAESVSASLDDPPTANDRLRLLWIACGKEDSLLSRNEAFVALLKDKGIEHQWEVTEGDHSWPVWRDYLAKFAPLLFR